jgi:hypothetical protein
MSRQTLSIPAVANSLWAAHFALTDRLRRAQGDALDALGLGPRECRRWLGLAAQKKARGKARAHVRNWITRNA